MSPRFFACFVLSAVALAPAALGCSADVEEAAGSPATAPSATEPVLGAPPEPTESEPTKPSVNPPPADNPGPAPAGCTGITKDKDGFFKRTTAKSDYTAFVPKSYAGKPTTLVVGMHGCGDSAHNFATWGVNPAKTRGSQAHIGISIGGKDGQCWDTSADAEKVTAAIADISTCFYVHQQKVVLAGFSSGGLLAYRMAFANAGNYAGILIENSSIGGASPASASWKIPVAHFAHTEDTSFPIAKVRADWAKIEAAGLPLSKKEAPGGHDGTSDDWSDFLLPKIAGWKAP